MVGFADNFPDDVIMDALGDDITLIKSGGGSSVIKAVFEYKYIESDDAARFDEVFPTIECLDTVAKTIDRNDTFKYGVKVFRILKKRPIDVGMTQIILKD